MPNKTQIKRQVSAKSLDNKPFLFILSFSICSKQKNKKKKKKKGKKKKKKQKKSAHNCLDTNQTKPLSLFVET